MSKTFGDMLGRHDARCPPGFRLHRGVVDHTTELRVRWRELFAGDGRRSAGRAQLSGDVWGRSLRRLGRVALRRDSSRTAKQLGRTHRQQAQHQGDRQSSHKRLAVIRSAKNLFPSLHRQCPFHTGKYGVRLNVLRVKAGFDPHYRPIVPPAGVNANVTGGPQAVIQIGPRPRWASTSESRVTPAPPSACRCPSLPASAGTGRLSLPTPPDRGNCPRPPRSSSAACPCR